MIEIDDRTVDQAVDEILGVGFVREAETPSAGGAQVRPDERAVCQECGAAFEKPTGSGATLCPACRRKRISAGRKLGAQKRQERKAMRERDKADTSAVAENQGSPKAEETVQEAWDRLGEAAKAAREAERHAAQEPPDPADMETDELLRVMADGLRRDTGDVILSLYETIRSVAKAGGMDPGQIVQALYEMDCILDRVGRRTQE